MVDYEEVVRLPPLARYRYFWRHDPLFAPLVILGVPALVWLVYTTWLT